MTRLTDEWSFYRSATDVVALVASWYRALTNSMEVSELAEFEPHRMESSFTRQRSLRSMLVDVMLHSSVCADCLLASRYPSPNVSACALLFYSPRPCAFVMVRNPGALQELRDSHIPRRAAQQNGRGWRASICARRYDRTRCDRSRHLHSLP